jgi:hypothetical protein
MHAMDTDSPTPFREKISRLGAELDSLHRAIKEEIELHERWSSVTDRHETEEEAQ